VFVERDRGLASRLETTLARLKVSAARVVCADALAWLGQPSRRFDLVFLDPPFAGNLWAEAAQRLEANGWLAESAWIYVEVPQGTLLALPANWALYREGKAGVVSFALYRRAE
jgi:16S rRNA (guanine966-N2)-methyltransferase